MPVDSIAAAKALVDNYCGWHVAPSRSETVRVEGDGGRVLLLPSLHVTGTTEVRDESGAAVTGWKVRENGVARGCWRCHELYEFDITHGYSEMPEEVQSVIDRVAQRGATDVGLVQQVGQVRYATSPATGTSLGGSLSNYDRAILDRYKLPPRP